MPDSTINGLTALTGAEVDQTADQFPIWDNSAATTKKITRTQLFSGPVTGDIGSAIRAAASDYAGVAFDGATASTDVRVQTVPVSIGSSDISIWARFKVPSSAGSVNRGLIFLSDSAAYASASGTTMALYITSGGVLEFRLTKDNVTYNARLITVSNFLSTYAGQVVDVVGVRSVSGNSGTLYINGTASGTESTFGSPAPNWNDTLASGWMVTGRFESTSVFNSSIYRSVLFNRALSSDDVLDLIEHGVNPADQWGTQTQVIGYNPAVLNGGFETNSLNSAGTWSTSVLGTSTATIDTSGSFSKTGTNAGKLTLDGSGNYASFFANNVANIITIGKRYRLSFWARKGATSGSCGVQYGGSTIWENSGFVLTTSYQNFVFEGIPPTSSGQQFNIGRQSGSAANSEIYIDDIELTRIGAIVDLDFTVGIGYQAFDQSTNKLDGTLFNAVSWTMPKKKAVLYATTSTNGNQQILATTAIPTSAFIEAIIVNSDGSGTATTTVSVGTASAGTQIVNAGSISTGRNVLTLATRFSSTGNLWVNANGTSNLEYTILYTDAA